MLTKTTIPILLSSLLLSNVLSAAPGGGLIADNTAGTILTLQDQTIAITGGTAQGGNLLHSFREFNVETDQTADFQAAANTQNIISRVTGPHDSWIDGNIKSTTSDANLYLVNPNGIIMSENASLDVNGAFHATTADYVTLADGQRVYADANKDVTLTVAAPEAFGFLDASVGKIQINGSQLRVADGQAISLVGGEIDITSEAKLEAAGGHIDLIGVASAGEVKSMPNGTTNTTKADISLADSIITVNNSADSKTVGAIRVQGANMTVNNSHLYADNNSDIDATAHDGVALRAETIELSDSQITARTWGSGQGGSVQLQATERVVLNNSRVGMETESTAANAGKGGSLRITAPSITLADEAQIAAGTKGSGQGGSVQLQATEQVMLNNSRIDIETADAGKGGSLEIAAPSITLADEVRITAETLGSGQGGSIQLQATEQVMLNNSHIDIATTDAGKGGSLKITAPSITLVGETRITAETWGSDQGGSIQLQATEQAVLNNSRIDMKTGDVGKGGSLKITAPSITLADKAQITAKTEGGGQGGSVQLQATEQVMLNNGHIDMETADTGKGGSLEIMAPSITLADKARITAGTKGGGQSGSVQLQATEQVMLNNSRIDMETENAGKGGSLEITAPSITLADEARIIAGVWSSGQGGSIQLQATKQVMLNKSRINIETTDAGKGGSLEITAPSITLAKGALISAATQGSGQGGSVRLDATKQVSLNNSFINIETLSDSENASKGGDLVMTAPVINLEEDTEILAATFGSGQSGSVRLVAVNLIRLSDQNTRISSSSHGTGAAGSVQIQANNLTLEGASIESTSGRGHPSWPGDTQKTGAAGQIRIDLSGTLHMSGNSQITTSTAGIGAAGDIRIGEQVRPAVLFMTDGAQITSGSASNTEDAGAAGRLVILTREQIQMQGNSALTTESENAGGGGIRVETRDLLHLQDSRIATSVQGGAGKGGDIQIDPVFVILENSQIQANAHGGAGGNITLVADYLLRSGPSVIEASSTLSTSGEIAVQAVDVDAGSLQATTQIAPLHVAQWAQVPCHLRRGKISRLIMAGYDAHPTAVDDVLSSLPLYTTLRQSRPISRLGPARPATPQTKLMPPAVPLTMQHGYLLASTGADVGCTML